METKEQKILLQKIKLIEKESLNIAQKYYSLLSSIGTSPLTEREIPLVAFTAIKGNISYSSNREEFCTLYKSSSPTINNIISKLKKMKILIKDGGKIKVDPKYLLDFNKNIVLQISLLHG
jgi:hypothetical protein